jgi:2'-5' RNA ligase
MYAILGLFDDKTNRMILDMWKEMREKRISFYGADLEENLPHITMASYTNLDRIQFKQRMDSYIEKQTPIEFSFQSIGTFLQTSTIYYAPKVTKHLLLEHEKFHTHFQAFHDPESMYIPNRWIPHCTLANNLSEEKLAEAYTYAVQRHLPFNGQIEGLALIKFHEDRISILEKWWFPN